MNEWEWQLLEAKNPLQDFSVDGVQIKPGSRVRLRPRAGGDVMDIALAGKTAVVEGLEQDYEGKVHICVVVDDDPGRDIGLMRQPGHRFFFEPEEVEPLAENVEALKAAAPRILIAGIGNIFLGDDAFGVEVARRLCASNFPANVKVIDFGIRGYDLAYALLDKDKYDATILVDACPRGEPAGTLYVIEPDLSALSAADSSPEEQQGAVEAHSLNPLNVLRLAASMGGPLKRILLVGCEPATLGPEEGQMGLSETVEAVIDDAVKLVESLVRKLSSGDEAALTELF
jgi:hydrogenase maturation protease